MPKETWSQRIKVSLVISIFIYIPPSSTILHQIRTWVRTGLFFFFPEGPHAQYADSSTPEASDGQWPHQASFQHRGQQHCSTGHANTPWGFFQSTHSSVLDMQHTHTHTHTKASQCKTQTGRAAVILGLIMCFSSLCWCFWWDKGSSAATLDVWCLNTYSGSFTALNHYRSAPPEFVPSHQRTYTADHTLNTRIIELNSSGIISWRCQALVFLFYLIIYGTESETVRFRDATDIASLGCVPNWHMGDRLLSSSLKRKKK